MVKAEGKSFFERVEHASFLRTLQAMVRKSPSLSLHQ